MYYYFLISEDCKNGVEDVFAIFDNEADAIRVIKDAEKLWAFGWKLKKNACGKLYAERFKPNPDEDKAVHEIERYKVVEMERGQCEDEPLFFKNYEEFTEYYY